MNKSPKHRPHLGLLPFEPPQVTAEYKYKPIRFFLIAFILSWIPWALSAYLSYQQGMSDYETLFLYIGHFGPAVSALILIWSSQNRDLQEDFMKRWNPLLIKLRFLPALFLLMPAILFLATAVSLLFGLPSDQFQLSDHIRVMETSGLTSLIVLAIAPCIEEIGWRGYGVDSLRSKLSIWYTWILFGLLWGLSYLPLFFIQGFYHHHLWEMGGLYVLNFFLSVLGCSFIVNWIYFKNGRSIIAGIIFHYVLDVFYVSFKTAPQTEFISTLIVFMVVAFIIWSDMEFYFDTKRESS
jgi:membrane protease YdiL (CAAX protease family)